MDGHPWSHKFGSLDFFITKRLVNLSKHISLFHNGTFPSLLKILVIDEMEAGMMRMLEGDNDGLELLKDFLSSRSFSILPSLELDSSQSS
jgi:hypothetical protein